MDIEREALAALKRSGIRASRMVDGPFTVDEIQEWFERHKYDDDPPKVAMSYVQYLLSLVDKQP